jgi:uncharacterized protein (DUF2267 family)
MKYKDIVAKTGRRANIPDRRADAVVKATVQALSEQASSKQFHDLLEQLPGELKQTATATSSGATQRSLEDFTERVRDLSGVDPSEAREDIRAAVASLAETVSYEQLEDLIAELPPAFMDLLPTAAGRPSVEEFLGQVRQAGGLASRDEAEHAVEATLSTLANRISAGQAQDMAPHLPAEFRVHLAGSPEQASAFDRETFLDRIATAEQTDHSTAERHARAVFAAVRETVPQQEFSDTLRQLPPDIGRLAR